MRAIIWIAVAMAACLGLGGCGYIILQSSDERIKASWSEVVESYPIMSLPALVGAALVLGAVLRMVLGRLAGSAATGTLIGIAAWWLQGGLGMAVAAGFVALLVSLLGSLGFFPFSGSGPGGGRRDKSSGGGFGGGGASGRW